MKLWAGVIGLAGIASAAIQIGSKAAPDTYVIFLTGNEQGHLAPCGCSFPMTGGAKRRASAIDRLGSKGRNIILESSDLISGTGRQDEIKLETLAQLNRAMDGAAMSFGYSESRLGPGGANAMSQLSGGRALNSGMRPDNPYGIKTAIRRGPFLVGSVSMQAEAIQNLIGEEVSAWQDAVANLVRIAGEEKRPLLLMIDGGLEDSRKIQSSFPSIALIQYKSNGHPMDRMVRQGSTVLATSGDGGKDLLRMTWSAGTFTSYAPISLEPAFKDESNATRLYKGYLKRVGNEDLLSKVERTRNDLFVGSSKCGKCHSKALKVWQKSKHSHGLETLEHEGHDRDPDCVACHVTGLDSTRGFVSRRKTPDLAAIGCESCHGAGSKHTAFPKLFKLPKVGPKSCVSCHRIENSPKFNFTAYWSKIRHK
jgi:hypothetical protein